MNWVLILFCCLWAVSYSEGEHSEGVCFGYLKDFCTLPPSSNGTSVKSDSEDCSALYGGFRGTSILEEVQKFANAHIASSFDYLLLASNFGGYVNNRKGFEKLFRHLSDSTWEDGIDLIKFVTKRGRTMNFLKTDGERKKHDASLSEITSLARAMDIQKSLVDHSFKIHEIASDPAKDATTNVYKQYDAEVTSFLENKFLHKHADIVRTLAGHIYDVKKLIANAEQRSVSLFLFDEYLQKHSF